MMKVNRSWMAGAVVVAVALLGVWRPWRGGEGGGRRIVYYQDSMHPWVKLDHPGKCTICAMDLTPIYEGDQAFATKDGVIVLSSNSITVLNVKSAEAKVGTLGATMRVAGTIEANQTLTTVLAAPAPGRIDNMTVEYSGVEVDQGQVLVTMYSPELALEKRRYLVRSRMANHVDPFQNSQVSSSMDLARVDVEVDPYFHDLLSPQSGTVLERNVYEGQYVGEGDTLMTIADSSLLWFRFDVYENQLAWFVPGQSISVTVPAVPGKVFPATVTFIEPTMDSVTRTVKVRAEIPNPRVKVAGGATMRLLRYGMYADGQVRAEIPDVLTVPRSAILLPGSTAYAYVDKGEGAYERRRVKLGRQGDAEWEVLSGVMVGERVVTAGNVLIDAQAQIMHPLEEDEELAGGGEDSAAGGLEIVRGNDVRLNSLQEAALAALLEVADGVSSALSSDDFELFKGAWDRLGHELGELGQVFGPGTQLQDLVGAVIDRYEPEVGVDLEAAREVFLPFSTALVELVQSVRVLPGDFRSVKVYHCPMAPEPGLWFQAEGPLANPYYGSEMLRCGNEVAPPEEGVTSAPLPAESVEELEEAEPAVSTMTMPMDPAHGSPAEPAVVMNHAAMGRKATVKSAPTLESVKSAAMRNRGMAATMDGDRGATESANAVEQSLPELPQDAGRNIRSGRHTVSKAFWQRAAEI
ncbi:MAG: hypothetical protein RI897_913 [Verrucomicrobiota bacterium]